MSFIGITYGGRYESVSCITQDHTNVGDSSQKLETWCTLYNLQAAQQVGWCAFQVAPLFFLAALEVAASSRPLDWSPSLLCSLAPLSGTLSTGYCLHLHPPSGSDVLRGHNPGPPLPPHAHSGVACSLGDSQHRQGCKTQLGTDAVPAWRVFVPICHSL